MPSENMRIGGVIKFRTVVKNVPCIRVRVKDKWVDNTGILHPDLMDRFLGKYIYVTVEAHDRSYVMLNCPENDYATWYWHILWLDMKTAENTTLPIEVKESYYDEEEDF